MTRAALVAAAICAGLAGWLWVRLDAVQADLAAAQAVAAGERTAARFRVALGAQAQDAAALDTELQQGAGADAPLSDYLRRGAGRVWP
jgi:hypothetical protein